MYMSRVRSHVISVEPIICVVSPFRVRSVGEWIFSSVPADVAFAIFRLMVLQRLPKRR